MLLHSCIMRDYCTHMIVQIYQINVYMFLLLDTLREESCQTNVILQYRLLASIVSAVCSVTRQSQYVLHFYYTLYDGKYDCKINTHYTIFQLQYFVLLNNHQYYCNITKSFLSVLLYIISFTNITISNNTVYFIVLTKFTFHIFYKTFQTMCMQVVFNG